MRHVSPVPVYAVWPYARDHMKPTTPYAAEYLDKCRSYTPPSKAHIKRVLRPRATIRLVRKPKADACPACPQRLDHNYVERFANATKAVVRNPLNKPVAPKTPLRLPSAWLTPPKPHKEDNWDVDYLTQQEARLAGEAEQARLEAERVRNG